MILCRVQPHPYLRRTGRDLLLDLPLTFAEATLGARVDIPTLAGPTVIKVPPGTASGTKLRLRGHGVRDGNTGETGDMYAVVRIQPPVQLSPRARELLETLDHELNQRPRENLGWPK
jgi:curved DNA-binding protein